MNGCITLIQIVLPDYILEPREEPSIRIAGDTVKRVWLLA